jgi:hypothetical protein
MLLRQEVMKPPQIIDGRRGWWYSYDRSCYHGARQGVRHCVPTYHVMSVCVRMGEREHRVNDNRVDLHKHRDMLYLAYDMDVQRNTSTS